jgi:hypothetical protein
MQGSGPAGETYNPEWQDVLTCRPDGTTVRTSHTGYGPDQQTSQQEAREPPFRLATRSRHRF